MDQRLTARSWLESSGAPAIGPTALSIAIGIVIFNNTSAELADLARTLRRAVARLTDREARINPFRATVVSIVLHNNGDAPVDPTPFGADARLTTSPTNLGFGRAHNVIMAEAFARSAEYYIAANPDGMFHPDALVEMIAVARRCDGRALVEATLFPEELSKVFDPLTLDTPWATGCCLLIPAAIYAAVGGFDENIFMYCEDVDLSWRARSAGFAVKHAPRALFSHSFKRPEINPVSRQAYLEAARYLASKWGSRSFARNMERLIAVEGWEAKALPLAPLFKLRPAVADFGHGLDFARQRWTCPDAIPFHSISRPTGGDNTVEIIVRFHDPGQISRLSRCLFSLYGQRHQPIQVLLMLQNLDETGVAAVNACVDAFDWSSPRRRPIITNVVVETAGDHRAKLWNSGLDTARARYVGFCDFDDVVYSAGYSYLLHRLQSTGAAAAFASAVLVNCTPMYEFDYIFDKKPFEGRDRYDFFVSSFCPANCRLVDRSRLSARDLYVEESLSKHEDYYAFAAIVAKDETDWTAIGTPVAEYIHRTDGSNTVMSHRHDIASLREWSEANKDAQQFLASLTAKVPVDDLRQMRLTERELRRKLAVMEQSLSWRLTRPIRQINSIVRGAWRRWKMR